VTAVAISLTQINVTWGASTDNVAVSGYQVFRNGAQLGTTTGTSYADSGLSAGTSYSYTVTAYDVAGNVSAPSTASAATTFAGDSTPPTVTLSAQNAGGQAIGGNVTVAGVITLTANASDPAAAGQVGSGLASLTLLLDGVVVASSANGVLVYQADTCNLLNASHTFTAVARDVAGNSANSQSFLLSLIGFASGWR
jgi:chitodextrinase